MRKIFMVGASAAASVLLMTGCNKQVIVAHGHSIGCGNQHIKQLPV